MKWGTGETEKRRRANISPASVLDRSSVNCFFLSPCLQLIILPVIVGFTFLLAACDKPGIVGLDVQPADDKLNILFNDTTSLITYTKEEDSIRTDETSYNLVGIITENDDLTFGKSSASFYMQFVLPVNNVNFGIGFIPDSLIMILSFSDYYGDLSVQQTIKVFELDDDIYADSTYYSNDIFNATTELASESIMPQDGDSVVIVKLNNVLINKFASYDSSDFVDNNAFLTFLKGFYITTDTLSPGSSILYFNLLSSDTKLTLYYHNSTDTASFDFVVNNNSARINHFEHDYSWTPDISLQLADSTFGQNFVYVHAMAGLKTVIRFPYLSNWADSDKILINKAELVIKVDDDGTLDTYKPADKLTLVAIDSTGQNQFLPDDEIYEGASYFGGTYDQSLYEYRFNIGRHVHEIINEGKNDYGLYLLIAGSSVKANRVVLKGGGNSTSKMKLNLTYTKL